MSTLGFARFERLSKSKKKRKSARSTAHAHASRTKDKVRGFAAFGKRSTKSTPLEDSTIQVRRFEIRFDDEIKKFGYQMFVKKRITSGVDRKSKFFLFSRRWDKNRQKSWFERSADVSSERRSKLVVARAEIVVENNRDPPTDHDAEEAHNLYKSHRLAPKKS